MTLGEIKNTETLALSTEQDGTQLPHHGRHGMLVAHGQKIRTWVEHLEALYGQGRKQP